MKKILLLLILLCVAISGCFRLRSAPEKVHCRVVTEITIQVENIPDPGLCRYSDPTKITKALNYLRYTASRDRLKEDPNSISGARYTITVNFSDGTQNRYDQISYTCFRKDSGPWTSIPPEKGIGLALLLAAVPSDTI